MEYELPFHKHKSTWIGFNWRYDSGLVASSTPCYNVVDPNTRCALHSFDANGNPLTLNGKPAINLSYLTPDEQFQAGLTCDGVRATPASGFTICDAAGLTSNLVSIPRINTSDDDRNPARIAPRSLFDIVLGDDNVFHKDKNKIAVRVTAVNLANKYALYNFLSTFSGTHYVTPRAITGQITYNF